MSRQFLGDVDLGSLEPLVLGAGIVGSLLWLAGAAFAYALRAPERPPVGARVLDLGPEPPAVANFLVNDFRVTGEAIAATALDLAARNLIDVEQRGVDAYYVRVRAGRAEPLAAYERRVLALVEHRARESAVPIGALATGSKAASKEWRQAFSAEVVADAQARGLSRKALDSWAFGLLVAGAAIPAVCFWAVWGSSPQSPPSLAPRCSSAGFTRGIRSARPKRASRPRRAGSASAPSWR
ncbi:MAG TPA: hypothetical protein VMK83_12015 [Gaiellaceae bacterium]|nr:hypothetical protein [Gaiellaceae bacterium]